MMSEVHSQLVMGRLSLLVYFLESKLGAGWNGSTTIRSPNGLLEVLKDGVGLCRLVDVEPKQNDPEANFELFAKKCEKIGLGPSQVFTYEDFMFEGADGSKLVHCLTQLRMKLQDMDRQVMLNSPIKQYANSPNKGLLDLIPPSESKGGLLDDEQQQQQQQADLNFTPVRRRVKSIEDRVAKSTGAGKHKQMVVDFEDSPTSSHRRVSINTLNTQASLAKVRERMLKAAQEQVVQLDATNKHCMDTIQDLQETIKNLQQRKDEYQLECSKLQDRNRILLCNYKALDAQIEASMQAWENRSSDEEHFKEYIVALHETWKDIMDSDQIVLGEEEEDEAKVEVASEKTDHDEFEEEEDEDEQEFSKVQPMMEDESETIHALRQELEKERNLNKALQTTLSEKLASLKFEFADLSNDFRGMLNQSATNFNGWAKELTKKAEQQDFALKDMTQRMEKESKRRKELLNMVHNLKGNIRVMCRIRPILSSDLKKGDDGLAVEPVTDETLVVTTEKKSASGTATMKSNAFEFDRVFGPTSTQQNVFDEVQPLVESVMDGYHACIFAYGQTGSGKTYTMSGDDQNKGINFLALEELFELQQQRRAATGTEYSFKVRNVEIYCEKVLDLLNEESDSSALDIRYNEREGVTMPGCMEISVATAEEVYQVMELGAKNRTSAHTKMNMESSRSHSVVMISVYGENKETGKVVNGKLVLVDLAGSERLSKSGVEGAQLKEAQAINKSLSCLGDVIAALESKAPHVPFRNSKLTTLLQDSLGKDNKALMILQVSPTTFNAQESTCSLNFGARVRKCELGKAKKKERVVESSRSKEKIKQAQDRIQTLETKLKKLSKELDEAKSAEQDKTESERKIQTKYENLLRNNDMEIKTLREKLANREENDNGRITKLETELHDSKVEINNLRQQLKTSLLSAAVETTHHLDVITTTNNNASTTATASTTTTTTRPFSRASPTYKQKRSAALAAAAANTPDKTSKKQVSWKNTPQMIPPSKIAVVDSPLSTSDENANQNISNSSSSSTRSSSSSPSRKSKTLGTAARVLQTPARKKTTTRTAARRVPASSRSRPAWQ